MPYDTVLRYLTPSVKPAYGQIGLRKGQVIIYFRNIVIAPQNFQTVVLEAGESP